MAVIRIEESRVIEAPAERLYAVVADYEVGHKAILPRPYFSDLLVEEGGQGEGTIINVTMEVFGSKQSFRQIVHEPEPGRVISERTIDTGSETRFIFEPRSNGQHTEVTIQTDFITKSGFTGLIERLMIPRLLPRIYKKELENLEQYVLAGSQTTVHQG